MNTRNPYDYSLADWQAIAGRELAAAETRLFIDGDYGDSSGSRFESTNPANREVIATVSQADGSDSTGRLHQRVQHSGAAAGHAYRGRRDV